MRVSEIQAGKTYAGLGGARRTVTYVEIHAKHPRTYFQSGNGKITSRTSEDFAQWATKEVPSD